MRLLGTVAASLASKKRVRKKAAMHSSWKSLLRSSRQGLLSLVAVVLVAFPIAAEPPQKNSLAMPAELKPADIAILSIGVLASPNAGPFSALGNLYLGASLDTPIWSLRGVFSTRPGRIHSGAALLFLTGCGPSATTPLMELVMLQAGADRDCWALIDTDRVRPLPEWLLERGVIRDRHDISNGNLEYEAYWQILVQAHYTSAKAFAKEARHDVTYVHLFNEPERYRGEVVHLSGRLIRLRRFDAPDEARAAGVAYLYESWIMTDRYGKNPICAVFTDLPSGLTVDNERKYNEPVGFDGYFYKRYRYKAADNKKANEYRDAPLLIGHSLTGNFGTAVEEEETWGHGLIWVFVGVASATVLGVVVLTIWFRYHDRRVRQRIHASRNASFMVPTDNDERFS
jgi:hypothetical protein